MSLPKRPLSKFHPAWIGAVLVVVMAVGAMPGRAEDGGPAKEPVTIRKTKDNLSFQLPPDWPIEKRGGITAPIPIEEYLAMKFRGIEAKLQALEQRLEGMDIRLRLLEEEVKKQR